MDDTQHYSHDTGREIVLPDSHEAPLSRPQFAETIEVESESSETHEFLEYWQILRRRKGAFFFIAVLGGLSGFLITLPQTPVYQTHTSVEINIPMESSLNLKEAASEGIFEYLDNYLQTQVRIMQSADLRARAVEKLKTKKRPEIWDNPGRLSAWRNALHLPDRQENSGPASIAALPEHSMQVKIIPGTRIVDLICDSTNPVFAAEFANTFAEQYLQRSLENRSSGSDRTKEWLARELGNLKVQLEKSEEQLQAYSRATSLVYTSDKETVAGAKLKQLSDQLAEAHGARIAKESQYKTASSAPVEALAEVVQNSGITLYQTKLSEMRNELLKLNTMYTPAHPKIKEIQEQIKELELGLEKERKTALARIRSEFETAQLRENMLATVFAGQDQRVAEEAGKAVQYNFIKREVDTNRQLYDLMLQKVKETEVVSAMRTSNVRVIDQARTPLAPYKPNMTMNIALGMLSGMFMGLVFIFVLEHADLSLKAPGDAALYLKSPELGVIPLSSARSTKSAYGDSKMMSSFRLPTNGNHAIDGAHDNNGLSGGEKEKAELVTWQHKLSLVAESYRAALTSILLSSQNGNRPRSIVFTSAGPGEGKTTTVTNLGIALAETNRRVLLIDADMRKPRLHDIFNLPNTWGLSDLLREKAPIESLPREALARETGIPGLFVLTSGPATVSISNLLYSSRTAELLRRFRQEYYAVLIDTPPMMQLADARILGRLADAAILVLGAGRTTRDAAKAAKQRLSADGIQVLGTILNRWDPKSASSYGVYGYYDGYYAKKQG